MPQIEISIGSRTFEVACQPGEEPYLHAAARMLDTEAEALSTQIGRMPETRMLLMAGLMLADRTAGLEDKLRASEAHLQTVEKRLVATEAALGKARANPEIVEVPVIPKSLIDSFAELTARAEALAERAAIEDEPEAAAEDETVEDKTDAEAATDGKAAAEPSEAARA